MKSMKENTYTDIIYKETTVKGNTNRLELKRGKINHYRHWTLMPVTTSSCAVYHELERNCRIFGKIYLDV